MRIEFFTTNSHRNPVIDFIENQPKQDQAKILGVLDSIRLLGLESNRAVFRQIEGKLWEIKIQGRDGSYRLFYAVLDKHTMTIVHGYKKQSQKAPTKEIEIAKKRIQEVMNREKDTPKHPI